MHWLSSTDKQGFLVKLLNNFDSTFIYLYFSILGYYFQPPLISSLAPAYLCYPAQTLSLGVSIDINATQRIHFMPKARCYIRHDSHLIIWDLVEYPRSLDKRVAHYLRTWKIGWNDLQLQLIYCVSTSCTGCIF